MNLKKASKFFNRTIVQTILISLITIIAYSNILQNGLSYDDQDFLLNWPVIQNSESGLSALLSLPELLAGDLPGNHVGVYRPIRSVYYLFSLQLWGFSPFFFHLQAIIVHLLISIIIYFIARIITKNKTASFFTGILFATHPVHTEAVSYTAASFDTIGILFFFASFYYYLKAEESKIRQGTTRLLSWLLAFLAFFTYEMTLVLPLLIIIYEICFKKLTFKNFLKRLSVYAPYLIILFGYLFVRFFLLKIGSRGDYLGPSYLPASNQAKLGTPEILWKYIVLLFFPLNLTVSYPVPYFLFLIFYKSAKAIDSTEQILKTISDYIILLPPLLVGSLLAGTLRLFRNKKIISFCLSWFLISLLPILNILPHGAIIAERYLYIPSFGFCLLLGLSIHKLTKLKIIKNKQFRIALAISIFILLTSAYTTRAIIRNFDWKSQESIFLSALKLEPTDFMANAALGSIYLDKGNFTESIKYTRRAVETNPTDANTHYQLARALEKTNNLAEAQVEYTKSLEAENNYYFANIALGNLYKQQGKLDDALSEYKKALAVEPNNPEALFNLAGIYVHKKEYPAAISEYNKLLNIKPNQGIIYYNLGFIEEQTGNLNRAILHYKTATELEPQNPHFHLNLGSAYERTRDIKQALIEYNKALALNFNNEELKEKIKDLTE